MQGSKVEHAGEDPYVTLQEEADDRQDATIRSSDLLVLAAKTEEDSASLEVWLFAPAEDNDGMDAYVHHDIMLPAFPLSVAWTSFNPSGAVPLLVFV